MVTPGFYPIMGGTETMVRNLSVELYKIGLRTDVMTFNMDKKWNPKWRRKIEKIDGIKVFKIAGIKLLPSSYRINMGISLVPGKFLDILKLYDIIHYHEADLSFPTFSFFVKKPKVFHLHGINSDFIRRYHLYRVIFKHVTDYYIAITKEMKNSLIKLGISKSRILQLPNAVDVRLFHPNKNKKEDDLLLYLGRITPVKGLHILLKSLRYLQKSVRLKIVGPADKNSEYYRYILKLIEKENQKGKHKVEYLGVIPTEEVIKLYQSAAIFVLPSFWEAFPMVILEALACETPVITTPVGGIPEVIQNFKNGILVPLNDPTKLAKATNYLLKNKDIRIKMGQCGREQVVNNFSISAIAKRLYNIYTKIINS